VYFFRQPYAGILRGLVVAIATFIWEADIGIMKLKLASAAMLISSAVIISGCSQPSAVSSIPQPVVTVTVMPSAPPLDLGMSQSPQPVEETSAEPTEEFIPEPVLEAGLTEATQACSVWSETWKTGKVDDALVLAKRAALIDGKYTVLADDLKSVQQAISDFRGAQREAKDLLPQAKYQYESSKAYLTRIEDSYREGSSMLADARESYRVATETYKSYKDAATIKLIDTQIYYDAVQPVNQDCAAILGTG